jgi:hypothetical protein
MMDNLTRQVDFSHALEALPRHRALLIGHHPCHFGETVMRCAALHFQSRGRAAGVSLNL